MPALLETLATSQSLPPADGVDALTFVADRPLGVVLVEAAAGLLGRLLVRRVSAPHEIVLAQVSASLPYWAHESWQAARMQLVSAVGAYLRHFAPDDQDWQLLYALRELRGAPERASLVWRERHGEEVGLDLLELDRSAGRQLVGRAQALARAGREQYGRCLGGVRALPLATPGRAVLVTSEGSVRGFCEEPTWR